MRLIIKQNKLEKQIKSFHVKAFVNSDAPEEKTHNYNQLHYFQNWSFRYSNELMQLLICVDKTPDLFLRHDKKSSVLYFNILNEINELKQKEYFTNKEEKENIKKHLKQKYLEKSKMISEYSKKMIEEQFDSSFQNIGYKSTTSEYKNIPSYLKSATSQRILKDYKNSKKDLLSGKRTYNNYKSTNPVFFTSKAIRDFRKSDKNNFEFTFLGIKFKTFLGRDKSGIESILDKVLSGEYKIKDSNYKFDGNDLYFCFSIEMPKKEANINLDKNKKIAIDLGYYKPICYFISGEKYTYSIGNYDEVVGKKKQLAALKRKNASISKNSLSGHGRKRKMKLYYSVKDNEFNYTKNKFHNYSKEIINVCLSKGIGTIILENLSNLKYKKTDDKPILEGWAPSTLQQFIKTKASEYNIDVVFINPAYTSQKCSECGYIDENNRNGRNFKCLKCNHSEDADSNAAKNILVAPVSKNKIIEEVFV